MHTTILLMCGSMFCRMYEARQLGSKVKSYRTASAQLVSAVESEHMNCVHT